MKRFLPWLVPIVVLLAAIPFLLSGQQTAIAKTAGVLVVVLTTLAIRFWMYRAGKLRTRSSKVKLTSNERFFLDHQFPYYRTMPVSEKKRLEEHAGMFLAEISFDRFSRQDPAKEECLAFAIVLTLLTWGHSHQDCSGKVVVFKENDRPEILQQEKHSVLFVNTAWLNDLLMVSNPANIQEKAGSEAAAILQEFYNSPA